MRNHISRGFTLPEMMVAIVVFSLLSLMGLQVLNGVRMASETYKRYAQQLKAVQTTMQMLQNDLTQMIPHQVQGSRGVYLGLQAGMNIPETGCSGIRLVRGGMANPEMRLPESHLLQVSYRVFNGQLERWVWQIGAGRELLKPRIQQLMTVNAMTAEFYDGRRWLTLWPVSAAEAVLPFAVRIQLTHPSLGIIERVWLVTGPVLPTKRSS